MEDLEPNVHTQEILENSSSSPLREKMEKLLVKAQFVNEHASNLLGYPMPEEMLNATSAIIEITDEIISQYNDVLAITIRKNLRSVPRRSMKQWVKSTANLRLTDKTWKNFFPSFQMIRPSSFSWFKTKKRKRVFEEYFL